MSERRLPRIHDETGLIGKIAAVWIVVLVLVGLLILDGISIALTTFKLSNAAQAAATTAAVNFKSFGDVSGACTAAQADLTNADQPIPEGQAWCKINVNTGVATITLHATSSSLVLGRLSFTKDFTQITAKESAEPSTL
jgi:hypothetical protein